MNKLTNTTLAALFALHSVANAAGKVVSKYFDKDGKEYQDAIVLDQNPNKDIVFEHYQMPGTDSDCPPMQGSMPQPNVPVETPQPTPEQTPEARTPVKQGPTGFFSAGYANQSRFLETKNVDAYGRALKKADTVTLPGVSIDARLYMPVSGRLGLELGGNALILSDRDVVKSGTGTQDYLNGSIDLRLVGKKGPLTLGIGPIAEVKRGSKNSRRGPVYLNQDAVGGVADATLTIADLVRMNLEAKAFTGSEFLPDSDPQRGSSVKASVGLNLDPVYVEVNGGHDHKEDGMKVFSQKYAGGKVMLRVMKGTRLVGTYTYSEPNTGSNTTERAHLGTFSVQFGDAHTR